MTLVTTLTLSPRDRGQRALCREPGRRPLSVAGHGKRPEMGSAQAHALHHQAHPRVLSRPNARPRQAPSAAALPRRPTRGEDVLRKGATVRIVKNRTAGIHQPAEWLEQYMGREGTVLWTTAGGAMVKLDKEATWFPYAELMVQE